LARNDASERPGSVNREAAAEQVPGHLLAPGSTSSDWVYREYDYVVFTMTIHPDVSGKLHVLLMHKRIFNQIGRHPGVRWASFEEIAKDFAMRQPRKRK
jgi:hypothetical protein